MFKIENPDHDNGVRDLSKKPIFMLQEQAVRLCGCVLTVMEYYVLRKLIGEILHLNLIRLLRAS